MFGCTAKISRDAGSAEAFATIGLDDITSRTQHIDNRFRRRDLENLSGLSENDLEWVVFAVRVGFRSRKMLEMHSMRRPGAQMLLDGRHEAPRAAKIDVHSRDVVGDQRLDVQPLRGIAMIMMNMDGVQFD